MTLELNDLAEGRHEMVEPLVTLRMQLNGDRLPEWN